MGTPNAGDYADGGESARTAFSRVGLFFNGRMLDEVTRLDIREYFNQRATPGMVNYSTRPCMNHCRRYLS